MSGLLETLHEHWPEYLMEAAGLGLFMVSAGLFGVLLFSPVSPAVQIFPDPVLRRGLMGLAMGGTAIALIYSPWGQQSGAHFNPAVTLTFLRLGKVAPWDAFFYILAQFLGGATGVVLILAILGDKFSAPPVTFVATMPGKYGISAAFSAEVLISFLLMMMVLITTNLRRASRYTGVYAGLLVATYIVVEAPISGMSMNPARSFASALPGMLWDGLWIYFLAPPLGMLLAATVFLWVQKGREVVCAKLNHHNGRRCIFRHCGFEKMMTGEKN